MSVIRLQLHNEKLSYLSKPNITNGNINIDSCIVEFDKNWNINNTKRYLYIFKNDITIDKIELSMENKCNFDEKDFSEAGEIYFAIIAINEENNIVKTSSRLKYIIEKGISKIDVITLYPEIKIYRNCSTMIEFDFSEFEFYNGMVEFTIKRNTRTNTLFTKQFTTNEQTVIVFDEEFTNTLNYSDYLYDLIYIDSNEHRYPLCLPSPFKVVEMINNG